MNAADIGSTRPYLIRALYEWCTDNGFTPFIAVSVDDTVRVPLEYVKDGEIVLNVSFDATSALRLGNDCIEFKGRFGGVARDIYIPVGRVVAIYARENGQGMAFPVAVVSDAEPSNPQKPSGGLNVVSGIDEVDPAKDGAKPPGSTGKPTLTRIK